MGTHDMAGCYWGLIGGLLGEKSGSRSPKWFQDLEGTPKPIPHRWHFPLGQNAQSEVQGATNGHHIHQVVGKLYVECDFRTFLISLEPQCHTHLNYEISNVLVRKPEQPKQNTKVFFLFMNKCLNRSRYQYICNHASSQRFKILK